MSKRRGYSKLATIFGVPLFVQWTLPPGGLLVAMVGGVDPSQWVYYCAASTLLIVVHEAGHVLAAVVFRLKIFSVEISGIGGLCRFERPRNVRQGVFVYAGGLLAQLAAFLLTLACLKGFGLPSGPFGTALVINFTLINFSMFLVSLFPYRNPRTGHDSDGRVLWRLYLHAFRGHPHPNPPLVFTPTAEAPVFPPETRLLERAGFRQPGWIHGIELLSDRTTPMDFVVATLMTHLGLTKAQAIVTTYDIHNTGGILIALSSEQEAQRIADAIATEALSSGHRFVCRNAFKKPSN
jgi:ATP-dependent Clp protease adapter protein ClpS